MHSLSSILFLFVLVLLGACTNNPPVSNNPEQPKVQEKALNPSPEFNRDSAYAYVLEQVKFGPRVPGSKAHEKCGQYFEAILRSRGLSVVTQRPGVTTYDGKTHRLYNVVASYKPEASERILFLAHWDTRHIADNDSIRKDDPIDGADDGASGAAVLLELARIISIEKPDIGVDFFFTDLEDYGQPNDSKEAPMENSWCLGTQYWAKMPHVAGYKARFGILFDMVGAKDAVFPREGTGLFFASDIVEKVWSIAQQKGRGNRFVNGMTGRTTDDHLYVNEILRIPTIAIVNMDPQTSRYGFYHHTHQDNITIIDKQTLFDAGQTALDVLYQEFE